MDEEELDEDEEELDEEEEEDEEDEEDEDEEEKRKLGDVIQIININTTAFKCLWIVMHIWNTSHGRHHVQRY